MLNVHNLTVSFMGTADYNDLRWMAKKISFLDSLTIRKCVSKAKWPYPIEELYFNKLASRRASVLESFDLVDPNPIYFNRKINIKEDGNFIVRNVSLFVFICQCAGTFFN